MIGNCERVGPGTGRYTAEQDGLVVDVERWTGRGEEEQCAAVITTHKRTQYRLCAINVHEPSTQPGPDTTADTLADTGRRTVSFSGPKPATPSAAAAPGAKSPRRPAIPAIRWVHGDYAGRTTTKPVLTVCAAVALALPAEPSSAADNVHVAHPILAPQPNAAFNTPEPNGNGYGTSTASAAGIPCSFPPLATFHASRASASSDRPTVNPARHVQSVSPALVLWRLEWYGCGLSCKSPSQHWESGRLTQHKLPQTLVG